MSPLHRTASAGDEFSMPDTYDSIHDGRETLMGRVSKTVSQAAYLMNPGNDRRQQQPSIKSPIPYKAPRRITAADIASPSVADSWSVQSYETKSPSKRSPSTDVQSYRRSAESPPGESFADPIQENFDDEAETPAKGSPSNHTLFRGWSDSGPELRRPQSPPGKLMSEESRRENLFMPFFS
mmetsp:Transcript_14741/g.33226  ORF Transcript_14741/g.33226 Transcript_14741/m.33226 type:complete len:181 (-) Transcript_14741:163-705(-)